MPEYELEFKTAISLIKDRTEKRLAIIQILEKELEIGHELLPNNYSGYRFTRGRKLTEEDIKGKTYELKCRNAEVSPF